MCVYAYVFDKRFPVALVAREAVDDDTARGVALSQRHRAREEPHRHLGRHYSAFSQEPLASLFPMALLRRGPVTRPRGIDMHAAVVVAPPGHERSEELAGAPMVHSMQRITGEPALERLARARAPENEEEQRTRAHTEWNGETTRRQPSGASFLRFRVSCPIVSERGGRLSRRRAEVMGGSMYLHLQCI